MQVAINPSLYDTAQIYAERQGLNLTAIIEDFLLRFTASVSETAEQTKPHSIPITPKVARLKTGRTWSVTDEELDKIRYEYLAEKYK